MLLIISGIVFGVLVAQKYSKEGNCPSLLRLIFANGYSYDFLGQFLREVFKNTFGNSRGILFWIFLAIPLDLAPKSSLSTSSAIILKLSKANILKFFFFENIFRNFWQFFYISFGISFRNNFVMHSGISSVITQQFL